jgi:hypothetical protein
VGVPSAPANNYLQNDFYSPIAALSYTGIFQECPRIIVREVYDAAKYPGGVLEPSYVTSQVCLKKSVFFFFCFFHLFVFVQVFRIFQSTIEVVAPAPCCKACLVNVTGAKCNTSGGCYCDPTLYQNAGCRIQDLPDQAGGCP